MDKLSDTKNFGAYLDRTLRMIRLTYVQEFKANQVDLTPEQWIILSEIYEQQEVSQSDLANSTFKNAPTVSRIIDLLWNKGYVERLRFEGDRRRYKVKLTKEGTKIVEKALPVVLAMRRKGWKGLTDADYDHLMRILNTIFKNYLPE